MTNGRSSQVFVISLWRMHNARRSLQNKCLRSIAGAYKAKNISVLEAESRVIPQNIHLDQAVLRSRYAPGCSTAIRLTKAEIRKTCVVRGMKPRARSNFNVDQIQMGQAQYKQVESSESHKRRSKGARCNSHVVRSLKIGQIRSGDNSENSTSQPPFLLRNQHRHTIEN